MTAPALRAAPACSVEGALEALKQGGLVVLTSETTREAVMIAAADLCEARHVNVMARDARGLVCLAITSERARQLRLPLQAARGEPGARLPFTVSIEARTGVTTGISAADRARTIQAAVAEDAVPADIVSPGHVFPVITRDGGVLVKAGLPEAAVELVQAAGLSPAAVFCQVITEGGEPAGPVEAEAVSAALSLEMVSIAQVVAWRRRQARIVERAFEREVPTIHGADFRMIIYRNLIDGGEHVAMVKGQPTPDQPTLVRSHAIDLAADLFGYDNGRRGQIDRAMQELAASDMPGVAIFLRNPSITWASHYALEDPVQPDAPKLGDREYGIGAQMLQDIGVQRLVLLTNSPPPTGELEAYGLIVESVRGF